MIVPLKLSQVADFCRETLNAKLQNGDAVFSNVNTDTRTLAEGELYLALRGERFDGHDFLVQAAEKIVCGLVVEECNKNIALPQLEVKDTLLAFGQIAAMNRNMFKKPLLAITGSSGKTTVKTMLANILSECGNVLATRGNLNNHIGVPMTLLQLAAAHDFAVIEMGASAIGEIDYLCSLAKPQIAMVNNVMPAHIAGFGSVDGVAQAKGEIYKNLSPSDYAIVNIDDRYSGTWLPSISAKIITVSLKDSRADCFAQNIFLADQYSQFDLMLGGENIDIKINALGEHSIRNALMAAAMAHAVGANLENIQKGLEKFSPVAGRMSRHLGWNNATVIDDSYNANPGSVRAAIDVLNAQDGTRILVLGDLGELGDAAESLHAELGVYAKQKKLDHLYTFGKLSRHASEAFGEQHNQHHFDNRDALIETLRSLATPTTTLLIKGSRSANMDLVVSALCSAGESH